MKTLEELHRELDDARERLATARGVAANWEDTCAAWLIVCQRKGREILAAERGHAAPVANSCPHTDADYDEMVASLDENFDLMFGADDNGKSDFSGFSGII